VQAHSPSEHSFEDCGTLSILCQYNHLRRTVGMTVNITCCICSSEGHLSPGKWAKISHSLSTGY